VEVGHRLHSPGFTRGIESFAVQDLGPKLRRATEEGVAQATSLDGLGFDGDMVGWLFPSQPGAATAISEGAVTASLSFGLARPAFVDDRIGLTVRVRGQSDLRSLRSWGWHGLVAGHDLCDGDA
jgi:hypothetical protein